MYPIIHSEKLAKQWAFVPAPGIVKYEVETKRPIAISYEPVDIKDVKWDTICKYGHVPEPVAKKRAEAFRFDEWAAWTERDNTELHLWARVTQNEGGETKRIHVTRVITDLSFSVGIGDDPDLQFTREQWKTHVDSSDTPHMLWIAAVMFAASTPR